MLYSIPGGRARDRAEGKPVSACNETPNLQRQVDVEYKCLHIHGYPRLSRHNAPHNDSRTMVLVVPQECGLCRRGGGGVNKKRNDEEMELRRMSKGTMGKPDKGGPDDLGRGHLQKDSNSIINLFFVRDRIVRRE